MATSSDYDRRCCPLLIWTSPQAFSWRRCLRTFRGPPAAVRRPDKAEQLEAVSGYVEVAAPAPATVDVSSGGEEESEEEEEDSEKALGDLDLNLDDASSVGSVEELPPRAGVAGQPKAVTPRRSGRSSSVGGDVATPRWSSALARPAATVVPKSLASRLANVRGSSVPPAKEAAADLLAMRRARQASDV